MTAVTMVQLNVDEREGVSDRIERTLAMTREAMRGADFVLLPELWPTGAFDIPKGIQNAEPIDGPIVTRLSEVAAANTTWLHGGSFLEVDGDDYFNTSVVFDETGDLVAVYRKIHLFGFDQGEAVTLGRGSEVPVIETPLGLTGFATCYDLRFPELFRLMHADGATAVMVPSGWPLARIDAWNLFARARAAENQVWLFGCNEIGTQSGVVLGGNSVVVGPTGEVVGSANEDEVVVSVEIDPDAPQLLRQEFPVLKDRQIFGDDF